MSYEDKTEHIILFPNKHKKMDRHPDIVGTMTDENGKKYRISAWKMHGKGGVFYSGKATDMVEDKKRWKEEFDRKKKGEKPKEDDNLSDIPF